MMRTFLFSMVFLLAGLVSQGQERLKVRTAEFEISGGAALGTWEKQKSGALTLGLALRCNLHHSGLDLGMYFAVGSTGKGYPSAILTYEDGHKTTTDTYWGEVITYMVPTVHYNWRRGAKISYFAGGGIGMMICRTDDNSQGGACFMPRAGVEFFNRLRLTADYKLNTDACNYAGLSVGFVFGGGVKPGR